MHEYIVKIKLGDKDGERERWERGKDTTFIAHKCRHALEWINEATKIF